MWSLTAAPHAVVITAVPISFNTKLPPVMSVVVTKDVLDRL